MGYAGSSVGPEALDIAERSDTVMRLSGGKFETVGFKKIFGLIIMLRGGTLSGTSPLGS